MRISNIVDALAELGPVDFFAILDPAHRANGLVPAGAPVDRVGIVDRPPARYGGVRRLSWLLSGRVPAELFGRDYGAVRAELRRWVEPHYDLVWFDRIGAHVAVSGALSGDLSGAVVRARPPAAIVDLNDLEDVKIRERLRSVDGLSRSVRVVLGSANARRWRDVQRSVAATVSRVVVCSAIDATRLGVSNVTVVPNGYDAPPRPAGRAVTTSPPTLLFAGLLTYPPNADAARHLASEIVPRLRARVPDAALRLVGKAGAAVRALHDPPRVTVTGWTDDMTAELARADVVAVAVRFGSGTRIKILEAFAHRVPVVSTSVGASGLDIVAGRHLLIADTPEDFARECERVLVDPGLRARLVEAAEALFLERYQWSTVRHAITELAARTAKGD
jgi:glycosyltransferase involved in cell wall biosynthesis